MEFQPLRLCPRLYVDFSFLLIYVLDSSDCSNDMDSMMASVQDLEITPARMREFLPKVNWDQLASMYVAGRSGAECVSRYVFPNGIFFHMIEELIMLLYINPSVLCFSYCTMLMLNIISMSKVN